MQQSLGVGKNNSLAVCSVQSYTACEKGGCVMKVVHSTYGDLLVNDDGTVRSNPQDAKELDDIVRFDLEEYAKAYPEDPYPDEFDILDVAFWTVDGSYAFPDEEFRLRVKEQI
jgi:hypothetical protein